MSKREKKLTLEAEWSVGHLVTGLDGKPCVCGAMTRAAIKEHGEVTLQAGAVFTVPPAHRGKVIRK